MNSIVGGSVGTSAVGRPLRRYIPAIDGLRAVAALSVIGFHSGFLPIGWAGVWFFYVVSGFVIASMMLSSEWALTQASYAQFFVNRAKRIWPLYFFVLLIAFVSFFLFDRGKFSWAEVIAFLTFTDNFYDMMGRGHPLVANLWTISVEQQFYLFFPVVFASACRWGHAKILGGVIGVSLLVRLTLVVYLYSAATPDVTIARSVYYFSPAHFDAFALGALLAFDVRSGKPSALGGMLQLSAITFSVALLGLAAFSPKMFLSILSPDGGRWGEPFWVYCLLDIFAGALLFTLTNRLSIPSRVLGWKPLVWVGTISYGVYVWHRPIGTFLGRVIHHAGMGPTFLLQVTLSVAAAYLSYRFLERRFHRRLGARDG